MKNLLIISLFMIFGVSPNAQSVKNYLFKSSLGNYVALTGTTTPIKFDTLPGENKNYVNQSIGFSFPFNGNNYTKFGVSSNGYIWFGDGVPSAFNYNPVSSDSSNLEGTPTIEGVISAMGMQLGHEYQDKSKTSHIESQLNGSGDVLTIQFTNFFTKKNNYIAKLSWQIKLNKSGRIDFIYGKVENDASLTTPVYPEVGLRGSDNTNYKTLQISSGWTAPVEATSAYAFATLSNVSFPIKGQTYSFGPNSSTLDLLDIKPYLFDMNLKLVPLSTNQTRVSFNLNHNSVLMAEIIDVTGKRFNVLSEQRFQTGENFFDINRNLASGHGLFFLKIYIDGTPIIRKIVY